MTRNLRSYGEAHPVLRAMARDPASMLASKPVRELKALLTGLGGDPVNIFEKADLLDRLQQIAGGAERLAAYCTACDDVPAAQGGEPSQGASGSTEAPTIRLQCVCGGSLERVSGIDRAMALYSREFPMLSPDQLRQLLQMEASCVVCD